LGFAENDVFRYDDRRNQGCIAMPTESKTRDLQRSSRFPAYAGAVVFTVVFVGFARTFYLRFLFHLPRLDWLLQLHGLLMTGWFVFFFVQIWLIKNRKVSVHRRLGWFGLGLVSTIVALGTYIAIRSAVRDLRMPPTAGPPPLAFMEFLLIDLVLFAGFVVMGIVTRRNRGYHMRFMVLACLSMSGPGIFRIPFQAVPGLRFLASSGPFGLLGFDLLLLYGCLLVDTIKHRRLHPAFALGGLTLILIDTPLFSGILGSPVGIAIGHWLVSLQS
jgi:hypothetical protein